MDPDAKYHGYKPARTQFDHQTECVLRAASGCARASKILLALALGKQKPPDEKEFQRQLEKAAEAIRYADDWVLQASLRPRECRRKR